MATIPSAQSGSRAQPQPNVYTVLLIVAVLALLATLVVTLWTLMAPMPGGYGLKFEDLFAPLKPA
jgi:hypothetical protein